MGVVQCLALLTVATAVAQKGSEDINIWGKTLCTNKGYEVRRLRWGLWASTTVYDSTVAAAKTKAEKKLRLYFNGGNDREDKIPATFPVLTQTWVNTDERKEVTVAYPIPKDMWDYPPEPTDPKVVLDVLPETIMYVHSVKKPDKMDEEATKLFNMLDNADEPVLDKNDYYFVVEYSGSPSESEIAIFATNEELDKFYTEVEGYGMSSKKRFPACLREETVKWSSKDVPTHVDLVRKACDKWSDVCTLPICPPITVDRRYSSGMERQTFSELSLLRTTAKSCDFDDVSAETQPILYNFAKGKDFWKGEFKKFPMTVSHIMHKGSTANINASCPHRLHEFYALPSTVRVEQSGKLILPLVFKDFPANVKCFGGYGTKKNIMSAAKSLSSELEERNIDHCKYGFLSVQFNSLSRLFNRRNEVVIESADYCKDDWAQLEYHQQFLDDSSEKNCGELEDWQDCLCSNSAYQVRRLHRGLWASTTMFDKSLTTAYTNARFRLSKYLNGHNDQGSKIQRKSPFVLQTYSGTDDKREVTVSVLLPKKLWKSPPIPSDGKVVLETIPETIMYVRTFPQKAGGFVADREAKRFFQLLSKNKEPIVGLDDYYYIFQYKRLPSKPSVNEIAIFATNKRLHKFYGEAEGLDKSDMRLPRCLQPDCSPKEDETCSYYSAMTWSEEEDVINVDLERECQKDFCTDPTCPKYKLEKSYTPSTEVRKYLDPRLVVAKVRTCNVDHVDGLGQPIVYNYFKDLGLMKDFRQMYFAWLIAAKANPRNMTSCPNNLLYLHPVSSDFKGEDKGPIRVEDNHKTYSLAAKCLAGYPDSKTMFAMTERLHDELHTFGVDHCLESFMAGQYNGQSRLFNRHNEVLLDVKPSCSWYEGNPKVEFRIPEDRLASVKPVKEVHQCDESDCLTPHDVRSYDHFTENFYSNGTALFVVLTDCTGESAQNKALGLALEYANGHNKEGVKFNIMKPVWTMDDLPMGADMSTCNHTFTTIVPLPVELAENPPVPLDDRLIVAKAGDFSVYQMPYHVPRGSSVFSKYYQELTHNLTLSLYDLRLGDTYFKHGIGVADWSGMGTPREDHLREIWVLKKTDYLKQFFTEEEEEDREFPVDCPKDSCYIPEIVGENIGFAEHKFHVENWVCTQNLELTCGHPKVTRSMVKAAIAYFAGANEAGIKSTTGSRVMPSLRTYTKKTWSSAATGACEDTFTLCTPIPKDFGDGEPPAPTEEGVVLRKGSEAKLHTYVVKVTGPMDQGTIDEALKSVRDSLDKHGMMYDQSVDVVYMYEYGWHPEQVFYAGYAMAPWGDGLGLDVSTFPSNCPNDTCFLPEKVGDKHGLIEHKFNIGNWACAKKQIPDCLEVESDIIQSLVPAIRGYFEGKNDAGTTAGFIWPGVVTYSQVTSRTDKKAGKCRDFYEFCVPIPREFLKLGIPAPTEEEVIIKKGASLQTFVTRVMGVRDPKTIQEASNRVLSSIDEHGLDYDQAVHVTYTYVPIESQDFEVFFTGFAMAPWGDGLSKELVEVPSDCPSDLCFPPTIVSEHLGLLEHKINAENWACMKKKLTDCKLKEYKKDPEMFKTIRRYFTGSNVAGMKADIILPGVTTRISKTNESEIAAGICKDFFEFCVPLPKEYQTKRPPAPTEAGVYIKSTKGGLQSYVAMRKGRKSHEAIRQAMQTVRRSVDSHGADYDTSIDVAYTYSGLAEDEDYQVFFAGYAKADWSDGLGKRLQAFPDDCPNDTCFVPELDGDHRMKHVFTAENWVCYRGKVFNCGKPEMDPYTFRAIRSYFEGNNEAGMKADIILPGMTTYISRTSEADKAAGICRDVFEFCVPLPRKLQYGEPPAPNSKKVYLKKGERLHVYFDRVSGFRTQTSIDMSLRDLHKEVDTNGCPADQSVDVVYTYSGPIEQQDYQVFFTGFAEAPWGNGLSTVVEEFPPNCPNDLCFLPEIVGTHGPFLEHKFDVENWVCVSRRVIHCGQPELSPSITRAIRRYFNGSNDAGLKAGVILPGMTTYTANTTEVEAAALLCRDVYEFCVPLPADFQKEKIPAPTEKGVYIKEGASLQTFVTTRAGFRTQEAITEGLSAVRRKLNEEQMAVYYDQTVDVVYTYAGASESEDYQIFFVGYAKAPWGKGHGNTNTRFPADCPSETCFLPEVVGEHQQFMEHKFSAENWACVQRNVTDCGQPQLSSSIFTSIRSYFSGKNAAELSADIIYPGITTYTTLTGEAEVASGICRDVFEFCVPLPKTFLEGDEPPAPTEEGVYIKKGSLQTYVTWTTGYRTQKAIGEALTRVRKDLDKNSLQDYDQTVDVVYTYAGPTESESYQVFFSGYAKAPWGNGQQKTVMDAPADCPSSTCFLPKSHDMHAMKMHKFDVENWACVRRNLINCDSLDYSPSIFKTVRSYFTGGNEAGKTADIILPGVTTRTSKTGRKAAAGLECHDTFEFCVPLPDTFQDLPAPTVEGVFLKTGAKLHTYVTKKVGFSTQEAIDTALGNVRECLHRHAHDYDETVDVVYTYAGPIEDTDYKVFYAGYAKAPWGKGLGNGVLATPADCPSNTCFVPEILGEHKDIFEHKFDVENWVCVKNNIDDCDSPDFSPAKFALIRSYFKGNNRAGLKADVINPGITTYTKKTSEADIAAGICKDVYEFCVPLPRDLKGDPPAPSDDEVYIKKGAALQAYVTRTEDVKSQAAISSALDTVREDLNIHGLDYDQTVDVVYSYHGLSEDREYQVFYAGYAKAPWGNGLGEGVMTFPDDCPSNNCFLPETVGEEDGFFEHKFDAGNWVCVKKEVTECGKPQLTPEVFGLVRGYFEGKNEAGAKAPVILPGVTTYTSQTSKSSGSVCKDMFEFCVPLPKDMQEEEPPAPTEEGVTVKKGASLQAYVTRRTGFKNQEAISEALGAVQKRLNKNGLEYDQTVDVVYTYSGVAENQGHQVFFAGYAKAPWGEGLGTGLVDFPSSCPSNTCFLPETVGEKEGFVEHKFEAENWACVQKKVKKCGHPELSRNMFQAIRGYFSGENDADMKAEFIFPGVTTYTFAKTKLRDRAIGICNDIFEFCVPLPKDLQEGEAPVPTNKDVVIKKGVSLQAYVTRRTGFRTQAAIGEALESVRDSLDKHGLEYDQSVDVVYSFAGPTENQGYEVFFAGYAKAPWGNGLGEGVVAYPSSCPSDTCFLPETVGVNDGFVEHKFTVENWVCVKKTVVECRVPVLTPSMFRGIRGYFSGKNEAGATADIILPGVTTYTAKTSRYEADIGICSDVFEFCVPVPEGLQEGGPPAPTEEGVYLKKGASLEAYVTRRTGFLTRDMIQTAGASVRHSLDMKGLDYDQTVDVLYSYAGPSETYGYQVYYLGYAKAPWGGGLSGEVKDFPADCPSDTCFLPETVAEKDGFLEHKFTAENWACVERDVIDCGAPELSPSIFGTIRKYFSGGNEAGMKAGIMYPGITTYKSKTGESAKVAGSCKDTFEFCVPLPKDLQEGDPPAPTVKGVVLKKGASLQAYVTKRTGFRTQEAIDQALSSVRESLEGSDLEYDQTVDVVYAFSGATENDDYQVFFAGYAKAPWGKSEE